MNRGWPYMIAAGGTALVVIGMLFWAHYAQAHDHGRPELDGWFKGLSSGGGGPCCDGSDQQGLADIDWETKDGHYRVRIEDQWWDVPDDRVLKGPNLAGRTMVWPVYYRPLGALRIEIRCFMPGSMI